MLGQNLGNKLPRKLRVAGMYATLAYLLLGSIHDNRKLSYFLITLLVCTYEVIFKYLSVFTFQTGECQFHGKYWQYLTSTYIRKGFQTLIAIAI